MKKEYEDSLKAYRDIKNSIDTALEKGREEGMAKGMEKGLEKGREEGMEKEKIATARRHCPYFQFSYPRKTYRD